MQPPLALALSLLSYLSLCQATSFIIDDIFAYPRYKLQFTDKKVPESTVFSRQQPKFRQMGWRVKHGNDPNKVVMISGNAQPFLCTIPDVSGQQYQHSFINTKSGTSTIQEKQHAIERSMELLQPLENECLYFHTHGYWSYEYCHMHHVRQFHFDQNQAEHGKLIVDEKASFILGKFSRQEHTKHSNPDATSAIGDNIPSTQPTKVFNTIQPNLQQTTTSSSSATLQRIGNKQALVYYWGDGTPCDITNQPRKIDIQFQCAIQDNDQIVFFEEVSICHYRMNIATPRLCNDFMAESQSHSIECNPIVPEQGITDHEQQQQHDDITKATIPTTKGGESAAKTSAQQRDDQDATTLANEQPQERDNNDKDLGSAPLGSMGKSELVGIISDLGKQVAQLKKSIDQQTSMDQLLLQQSQVAYMDENGQLILGGVGGSTGNTNNLQQQQQQQQQQPQQQQQAFPIMGRSDTQQQNKKAYKKSYYSVD